MRHKQRILEWLLEHENPSVRYFTLRDIMHKKHGNAELVLAKAAIPKSRIVNTIFSHQHDQGYWGDPKVPYVPKYKASYWQIMLLGYLGVDKSDPRVQKACDYIFMFQNHEGGFSAETEKTALRAYGWSRNRGTELGPRTAWVASYVHDGQLSCLTGNVVAALLRLGYTKDARVKRAIQWLARIQNWDGGWLCPYWRAHIKDTHGCFYGTIGPLEAFSELSKDEITPDIRTATEKGTEFLLMHHLFKADHHGYTVIRKSWLDMSFPWFYNYSILRGLDILTKLGLTKDKRLQDAVRIVRKKQKEDGTWSLDRTPAGRMYVGFGAQKKPNKWITLTACRVLTRLHNDTHHSRA